MPIIGAPAIDRANNALREYDYVTLKNPSAVSGKVTLVRFYLSNTIIKSYAGTVYITVPGPPATILTREKTADLGGFAAGYHEVVTDLAVEPGDYIAFWHNRAGAGIGGYHDLDTTGGAGTWARSSPFSGLNGGPGFTLQAAFELSLEGTIVVTTAKGFSKAYIIG